jgi:hypothetical protein
MDFNKATTSTPKQVQKLMIVLHQMQLKREQFDREISVIFNELYVRVNSLPMSDYIDLPLCSAICDSLFDIPNKRKRENDDYYYNDSTNDIIIGITIITITGITIIVTKQ